MLIEGSPVEKIPGLDVTRCVNESLLLQFFLLRFIAMIKWGDTGPGERLQHGIRTGFTDKYPHLASTMTASSLAYARMMENGPTDEAIWNAAAHYCGTVGTQRDATLIAASAAWIAAQGENFHNTLSKIAEETRLT